MAISQKKLEANRRNAQKAGRPPGVKNKKTVEQEQALKVMQEEIRKEWRPLVQAQMDLAKGIYYEKINALTGVKRIYKLRPDNNSLDSLIDRVVGRPKEHKEVDFKWQAVDEASKAMISMLAIMQKKYANTRRPTK